LREKEDEVLGIGKGKLGHLLAWRAQGGLVPCLLTKELPYLRRAHLRRRVHHQWGGLRVVRLQ
jgi:hypothetical protein